MLWEAVLLHGESCFKKTQLGARKGEIVLVLCWGREKMKETKGAFNHFLLSSELVLASECVSVVEDIVVAGIFGWCFQCSKLFLKVQSRAQPGGAPLGSTRFVCFCGAMISLETKVVRAKMFWEQQVFLLLI